MLRTRLWMGAILIALVVGALAADPFMDPWAPCLFVLMLSLSLLACRELLSLLGGEARPVTWLCYATVGGLIAVNWLPSIAGTGNPWAILSAAFAGVVLLTFIVEMARFRAPGHSMERIGLTIFIAGYLGFLPSFLAQLRWLGPSGADASRRPTTAMALAIFVPKVCDIGAYFTGRFLGRRHMAPVLSPKKTWEGAAGGIAASALAAVFINHMGPAITGGVLIVLAFGAVVGMAGMFGDLAESLIKRDCGQKDSSRMMPGFGGVLDVVDAILFSAPVSYCLLRLTTSFPQAM
jgi:phosphatidate cytidylyltransferase